MHSQSSKGFVGKKTTVFSETSVGPIKKVIIKVEGMTDHSSDRCPIYGVTVSASIKHTMDFSWITSHNS